MKGKKGLGAGILVTIPVYPGLNQSSLDRVLGSCSGFDLRLFWTVFGFPRVDLDQDLELDPTRVHGIHYWRTRLPLSWRHRIA